MKFVQFIRKLYVYAKKRCRFFNIDNLNILDQLFKELCYKKFKKKYKKYLKKKEYKFEKNADNDYIWIFWYQGIDNAPQIVKRCVESIKKYNKNKKIVILDSKNLYEYIKLPNYIEKKYKKGIISITHYSDLIRLELLTTYGGTWIDSTVLLTNTPFFINEDIPLFVYKNISLFRKQKLAISASSWLIHSNGESNILMLTKELLFMYWKKYNVLYDYSLFHILFTLATEVYQEEWNNVVTYSNIPTHILQFELNNKYNSKRWSEIKSMSSVHKLTYRIKSIHKDDFYNQIINNIDRQV